MNAKVSRIFRVAGRELWYALLLLMMMGWVYNLASGATERTPAHLKWPSAVGVILFYGLCLFLGLKDLSSREAREFDLLKGARIGLLMAALSTALFACVSFLLWRSDFATYTGHADLTLMSFVNYYWWVFLDTFPGLKASEALAAPLKPTGFVAGLPVVSFRAFVLFGLIKAFKAWWVRRSDNLAPPGMAVPS
jgi:hypothetical protein